MTLVAIAASLVGCGESGPQTADDFAQRSCEAFLGTADVPVNETREQDRARQRRETADAVRAADLDARWRTLAEAQKVLLRVNEREPVSDDERETATQEFVTECEKLRRY